MKPSKGAPKCLEGSREKGENVERRGELTPVTPAETHSVSPACWVCCLGCASLQVGVPGTAHSVHELVPVLGIPRTFAAFFVDFATKSTGPIGGDLLLHDFCSLQEQTTHLLSNSMFSSDPSVPGKTPLKPREILL
jgi:hypothetical protein